MLVSCCSWSKPGGVGRAAPRRAARGGRPERNAASAGAVPSMGGRSAAANDKKVGAGRDEGAGRRPIPAATDSGRAARRPTETPGGVAPAAAAGTASAATATSATPARPPSVRDAMAAIPAGQTGEPPRMAPPSAAAVAVAAGRPAGAHQQRQRRQRRRRRRQRRWWWGPHRRARQRGRNGGGRGHGAAERRDIQRGDDGGQSTRKRKSPYRGGCDGHSSSDATHRVAAWPAPTDGRSGARPRRGAARRQGTSTRGAVALTTAAAASRRCMTSTKGTAAPATARRRHHDARRPRPRPSPRPRRSPPRPHRPATRAPRRRRWPGSGGNWRSSRGLRTGWPDHESQTTATVPGNTSQQSPHDARASTAHPAPINSRGTNHLISAR